MLRDVAHIDAFIGEALFQDGCVVLRSMARNPGNGFRALIGVCGNHAFERLLTIRVGTRLRQHGSGAEKQQQKGETSHDGLLAAESRLQPRYNGVVPLKRSGPVRELGPVGSA